MMIAFLVSSRTWGKKEIRAQGPSSTLESYTKEPTATSQAPVPDNYDICSSLH